MIATSFGLFVIVALVLANGSVTANESQEKASKSQQDGYFHPMVGEPAAPCREHVAAQLRVDQGHPWKPPFGIDRVGAPLVAHVEVTAEGTSAREYFVVSYRDGGQVERQRITVAANPAVFPQPPAARTPLFGNAPLASTPTEVGLEVRCPRDGSVKEFARQPIIQPDLEADAVARPNRQINPVDLGAILVPHDWLLLAGSQSALISAAAISHARDWPNARLRAWFEGGKPVETSIPLTRNQRATKALTLPFTAENESTVLHVTLTDGRRELWKKEIRTMVVAQPPRWPVFGAVETKLRYDAPISVKDWKTGDPLPSIDYDTAWDSKLKDVVVFLPNGSRFVFWRGSSYIPFWAGLYNTGVSYEWAENLSWPKAVIDSLEPLNDRELRYGSVRIVESTASRIHVRWTYQSTDMVYQTWGDQAVEDFYFYPDGFGTRVLTLIRAPGNIYQLSEFMVLTPQSAFPLEILPSHMADVLFLDGEKQRITFPFQPANPPVPPPLNPWGDTHVRPLWVEPRQMPMVYRVFAHKDDPAAAIYFYPRATTVPFAHLPFFDRGERVTPAYWGSHWPLSRGQVTVRSLDDQIERIHVAPGHVSLGPWLASGDWEGNWQWEVEPHSTSQVSMPDTLGHSRNMTVNRWAWLIANTNAAEEALLDWAHSFSDPPSLQVKGARIDFPSYSPQRRALRLVVESPSIEIVLKPVQRTVNPVFELDQAPPDLLGVMIDGKSLSAESYAWDGATLWMRSTIGADGTRIALKFRRRASKGRS